MSEKRQNTERRIRALRRSRDTFAAYGDAGAADRLLDQISDLERQLQATHQPGRKPTEKGQ